MRIFISFNVDEQIRNHVSEIQQKVKEKQKPSSKEFIKWENKNKFHITVFFLGDVKPEKADVINKELDIYSYEHSHGKIIFESNGFSCFPNCKYPRILFVDLKNSDGKATEFYKTLSEVIKPFGFVFEKKFRPHLTLARIKGNFKPDFVNLNEEIKFNFNIEVSKFHLMESKLLQSGSLYKEIRSFDL
jgi:RNA 2',3'-cyclic 3'-phosphodiesterase